MRRFLSGVLALVLSSAGLAGTAGSAGAEAGEPNTPVVVVLHGGVHGVTVNRHTVPAGKITFKMDTSNAQNGSIFLLFRPVAGATTAQLLADFGEEGSSVPKIAARGTRDLRRDFIFFGLASTVVGTPAVISETLRPGKYFLVDGGAAPKFETLSVRNTDAGRGDDTQGDDAAHPTVAMTKADMFRSPRVLPARGAVTVRNEGDSIHQLDMLRVRPRTTDAQVQAYLESPAFAHGRPARFELAGPTVGLSLLSPGGHLQLRFSLPRGTYLLVCRVADDKTGIAHLVMGMHQVVQLR